MPPDRRRINPASDERGPPPVKAHDAEVRGGGISPQTQTEPTPGGPPAKSRREANTRRVSRRSAGLIRGKGRWLTGRTRARRPLPPEKPGYRFACSLTLGRSTRILDEESISLDITFTFTFTFTFSSPFTPSFSITRPPTERIAFSSPPGESEGPHTPTIPAKRVTIRTGKRAQMSILHFPGEPMGSHPLIEDPHQIMDAVSCPKL